VPFKFNLQRYIEAERQMAKARAEVGLCTLESS
jgi:hypothetical protein